MGSLGAKCCWQHAAQGWIKPLSTFAWTSRMTLCRAYLDVRRRASESTNISEDDDEVLEQMSLMRACRSVRFMASRWVVQVFPSVVVVGSWSWSRGASRPHLASLGLRLQKCFFLHRWSCSQAQTVSSSWISNLKNQIDCYLGGVFSGVVASGFGLAERSWFFTFARSSLHQMVRDLKVSSCTRARRSVRLIASRWSRPTGSNGYFIDSITSVRWALQLRTTHGGHTPRTTLASGTPVT